MRDKRYYHKKDTLKALYHLWEEFLSRKEWIPLDRWLSYKMRETQRFSKEERLWISRHIIHGCRFGIFISYMKYKGYNNAGSFDPKSMVSFSEKISGRDFLKEALLKINSKEFFDTLFIHLEGLKDSKAVHPDFKTFGDASLLTKLIVNSISPDALPFIEKRIGHSKWNTDEIDLFLNRHQTTPPLWLRLNRPEKRETVIKNLRSDDFKAEFFPPSALKVSGGKSIYETEGYKNGDFDIQDISTQKIVWECNVTPGQFIWDACAGCGGKSMQIASVLKGKGLLYASDINKKSLDSLRIRGRRNGLNDIIRVIGWEGTGLPKFGKVIRDKNGFDMVLVDAPCSGSGTWRRNPDGKLFFNQGRVGEITSQQSALLSNAARAVRPGGALVYATCSIFCEEDEEIVNRFLSKYPNFSLLSMRLLGNPEDDSDATFIAIMKRTF